MTKTDKELFKHNFLKQFHDKTNPLRYLAFKQNALYSQECQKLFCTEYNLVICIEKSPSKDLKDFSVSFRDISRIDLIQEGDSLDLSDKNALMREKCYRENILVMGDGIQIDLTRYKIINNDYIFSLELDLDSSPEYLQFDMVCGTYKTSSFDNGTEFRQLCAIRQKEDVVYIPFECTIKFKGEFLNAPWAWRLGMERTELVSELFKTYNPNGWFLKPFVELMEKINYQKTSSHWF